MPLATETQPYIEPKITGGATERQGLDLHKKIVMLVRLYFPKLASTHQIVFRSNSAVNTLIHEAEAGHPLSEDHLLHLSGAYRDAFVAMEEEIIQNRRILVKDHLLPVRYKHVHIRQSSAHAQ